MLLLNISIALFDWGCVVLAYTCDVLLKGKERKWNVECLHVSWNVGACVEYELHVNK